MRRERRQTVPLAELAAWVASGWTFVREMPPSMVNEGPHVLIEWSGGVEPPEPTQADLAAQVAIR